MEVLYPWKLNRQRIKEQRQKGRTHDELWIKRLDYGLEFLDDKDSEGNTREYISEYFAPYVYLKSPRIKRFLEGCPSIEDERAACGLIMLLGRIENQEAANQMFTRLSLDYNGCFQSLQKAFISHFRPYIEKKLSRYKLTKVVIEDLTHKLFVELATELDMFNFQVLKTNASFQRAEKITKKGTPFYWWKAPRIYLANLARVLYLKKRGGLKSFDDMVEEEVALGEYESEIPPYASTTRRERNMQAGDSNWNRIQDYANLAGVDPSTVWRWTKAGKLTIDENGKCSPPAVEMRKVTDARKLRQAITDCLFEMGLSRSGARVRTKRLRDKGYSEKQIARMVFEEFQKGRKRTDRLPLMF